MQQEKRHPNKNLETLAMEAINNFRRKNYGDLPHYLLMSYPLYGQLRNELCYHYPQHIEGNIEIRGVKLIFSPCLKDEDGFIPVAKN